MKTKNYHQALTDYINASIGLPFEWGTRDCATYVIGALEAMIGHEVEKPKFAYRNHKEALGFARHWSLEKEMKRQLNAYGVRRNFHQTGDIILVERGGFECAHVVFDRRAYAPLLNDRVQVFDVARLYEACPDFKLLRFD